MTRHIQNSLRRIAGVAMETTSLGDIIASYFVAILLPLR
jgi:hypothetical protein